MTEFKVGDIVKVPWSESIGVITDYSEPYFIVRFIFHYSESHAKNGGYLAVNLEHIT